MTSDNTNKIEDLLVLIKYEDVCVPVHRSKLIAKSKFFETAFSDRWGSGTEESQSGIYKPLSKILIYMINACESF